MQQRVPAPSLDRPSLLARYQQLIDIRATERLLRKARGLAGLRVLHVNSTRQGGGAAEILSSLTPLMNDVDIETDWMVIDGSAEFFASPRTFTTGFMEKLSRSHRQARGSVATLPLATQRKRSSTIMMS